MKLLDFYKELPDESACRAHFKAARDKEGVFCKKCGGQEHWWLKSKSMYECKKCGFRMSLRSGTVMENSKLPFLFWYVAMHLMSATKRNVSALEVQMQVGHKYYEPIWAMMHKIRRVMANRDEKYRLKGEIELDEAFFEVNDPRDPDEPVKRGAGSQRQARVLVMAESTPVEEPKKGRKKFRCGFFKMIAIPNLEAETISQQAGKAISEESTVRTDNSKSHSRLHKVVKKHEAVTMPGKESCKALPWVHTSVSNAKAIMLATYRGISEDYIQNYLSEFCYKLNRRYHGFKIFDRVVVAATYHWNL